MVAMGSLGVGTTTRRSGSSFTVDLLGLLLLCTKSQVDLLATINLVLAE
jgi:hypothetical protein